MPAPKGNQYAVGNPGNTEAGISKYDPKYIKLVEHACRIGFTDNEIAAVIEVHPDTLREWKLKYEDFARALKSGKELSDERVERTLFQKAIGYSYEVEKVFFDKDAGKIVKETITEHVPPDTTSCIFWLKNRRPDKWRDVHKIEHGKPGDFDIDNASADELVQYITRHAATDSEGEIATPARKGKGRSRGSSD